MKCFSKIPLTLTQRKRVIFSYREVEYGIYSSEAGSDSRDKHTHAQLDSLIENVDMTISSRKGDLDMSAREKFEGFKKKIIDENGSWRYFFSYNNKEEITVEKGSISVNGVSLTVVDS